MVNELIEKRSKEAIVQAQRVIEVLSVVGIPVDFGLVWLKDGAEFFVDVIHDVVTVKMGPNYQLVANTATNKVTVFSGNTWINFLKTAHDKHVKGNKELKNQSEHKFNKYMGL